jgi:hypothetical protein
MGVDINMDFQEVEWGGGGGEHEPDRAGSG